MATDASAPAREPSRGGRIALVLAALGAIGTFAACKKDKKTTETDTTATDPSAKPTDTTATPTTPTEQPAEPATGSEPAAGAAPATGTEPAAGAAPAEPAAGGEVTSTGIPECDSFVKRILACEKYPPQSKDALKQGQQAWKSAHDRGGDAEKMAADSCKKSEEAADQALKGLGC